MTTTELYTKGACVWVPDPEAVWVSAQLLQDHHPGDQHITIQLSDGTVLEFPVKSSGLPPLGNPDILEGENDLTALTFLHEAAVLHNLRVRFLDYNSIYTYCGIVLVALNPYEPLPIYGEEVIDAYSGQDTDEMEPHIFSVAEEAYRTMIREEKNQSIIISGESGSGKTVSAKFTMRYFAVVGGASQQTTVEEKVLASNPIMEAIGNAKTTRNDNSSRFGKYIQIEFGCRGDIVGANMRTYLLEKSRVVSQPAHERNYHIFYQLCSSRNLPELRILKLESAEDFHYTNQGQEVQIPGVNDAAELERTRQAFTTLGVQPDQQMEIFRVLAAILHLGNVKVKASGRDGDHSYIDVNDRSLVVFAKLLGVEGAQMAQWLCHKRLAVGAEVLVKPMTGQQAKEARDALTKHMYEQLFTWMVLRLNLSLRAHREKPKSYIGVLDIYGFEMFEKNSFEQFCINYANEKLQQQFNRHVFQLEQEEYMREEIPWNRIEFSDNQPCIDLIEGQLGMLDLLDEECRMPKGSDENWAQKLYDQHMNHSFHFRKPRLSNSSFIILHFADTVQYECEGFLDKNRDTVFEEPVNILRASQSELVAELFQKDPVEGSPPNSSLPNKGSRSGKRSHRDHKLTVGFQFRQSLNLLMDTLNSTTPHYVRCIKSNDLKQPFLFDPKRAVQQLRACGVLETIRISAAGFPSRWTYAEFFSRYRVLLRGGFSLDDVRWFCQRALPDLIPDAEQYCFGKTKVFFRAGQVALLEKLRGDRLYAAGIRIQSWVRGWLQRRRYQSLSKAALILQRYIRGTLARRLAWAIRYTRAALIIQKTYRMVSVRQLYLTIRNATIKIQSFVRGFQARQIHRRMLVDQAVVSLQAWVRGWLTRRRFTRLRAAVVLLQSCVRRRAARKELLRLRTEARSMERYRELNKGMEVKLMQLQLRADQQTRECGSLKETLQAEREAHNSELELLRSNLHKLQSQMKANANTTPSLNEKNEEQRRKAEEKVAEELLQLKQEIQVLRVEKESLETERNDLVIRLQAQQDAQEVSRQQSANHVDASVRADLDEERSRYQSLLREFTRLEQRYDNLRDMSIFTTDEHPRGHRRTDSIVSLEPPSPITTSYPGSPIFSSSDSERRISVTSPEMARRISVTSPEMVRRISVTSPEGFRRFSVTSIMDRRAFSLEEPLDLLMEELGIAKNKTEKLNFEDLNHAYDAVRVANKFLETQLLSQKEQWEEEVSALRMKLQQAQDSSRDPEMMDLNAFHERECSRLRQEVKELKHTVTLRRILSYAGFGVASQEPASPSSRNQFPTGLLECRKKDESKLIKSLITDVKAEGIISLVPGLAARVLFLCVRQMDCCEDRMRVKMFCGAVVSAIKTALKKHVSDSDATAAWLKNSYLLKDLLNQHSPPQDMGCEDLVPIRTDVQECVRALGDVCIQAYQQLLYISESRLQPIIVPAMLESETIPGLSVSTLKLGSGRKRSGSDPRPPVSTEGATMSAVLRELTALHTALSRQDLPAALLERAFHQLIYLLATTTLNSLLLRKDMCCWNRGLQIRYNVSVLEEWLRSRSLQTGGAVGALEPLIQAAQLLQMSKKTEADGEALVQTCNALSSQQIVKILGLYTPQSDLEERVTLNFIRAVQVLLKRRSEGQPPQLLMDVRRVFPVTFPYLPPAHVSAAQLEIPESLKISFLRRV